MRLVYRDFAPKMVTAPRYLTPATFESLAQALATANAWLAENPVDLVNVETVVLPNIWNPNEQGSEDTSLASAGGFQSTWHQFIRIWYREASAS